MNSKALASQLRIFVASNRRVVITAALVFALFGGWLTYGTYVASGTYTEQQVVSSWESTTDISHGVIVQNPNPVFPEGQYLRNRSLYYTNVSERLLGHFTYGFDATDNGTLSVNVTLYVVHTATSNDGDTTFWRDSRLLATRNQTLESGEQAQVPYTINITEEARRISRIQNSLGAAVGSTQSLLRATVEVSGTVNGKPVETTEQHTLSFHPGEHVFRVDQSGPTTETRTTMQPVQKERSPGGLRRILSPLIVLSSSLVLVGMVWFDRRGHLKTKSQSLVRARFEHEREKYDDWITEGTVPKRVRDVPTVEVNTLEGLVDVAIDTENRVIQDGDTYVVRNGGVLYRYESPTAGQISQAPDDIL